MSKADEAFDLCEEAYEACRNRNYKEAVRLANQATKKVEGIYELAEVAARDYARHIIRLAQRRIDNPAPSFFRRLLWAVDGEWLIALAHSNLGSAS